jgi:hypothetical protein
MTTTEIRTVSMDEIKRRYQSGVGRHWFDPGTMRFFGTRLPQYGYEGSGGVFFVTSERFVARLGSKLRKYSVRKLRGDGDIETIGEFNTLSKYRANTIAKKLAGSRSE